MSNLPRHIRLHLAARRYYEAPSIPHLNALDILGYFAGPLGVTVDAVDYYMSGESWLLEYNREAA